jgi:hypothetical protein
MRWAELDEVSMWKYEIVGCYYTALRVYCHATSKLVGRVVSDYGLDDRAIDVRSPAEAEGFFL